MATAAVSVQSEGALTGSQPAFSGNIDEWLMHVMATLGENDEVPMPEEYRFDIRCDCKSGYPETVCRATNEKIKQAQPQIAQGKSMGRLRCSKCCEPVRRSSLKSSAP